MAPHGHFAQPTSDNNNLPNYTIKQLNPLSVGLKIPNGLRKTDYNNQMIACNLHTLVKQNNLTYQISGLIHFMTMKFF